MSTATIGQPVKKTPARSRRTSVPAPAAASVSSPGLDALTGGGPTHADGLERVEVDPRTLVLDVNARKDLRITAEFTALIAEHGVLVPLLCRRDLLGQLLVVDGQRRLVVAIELDLPLVPVALLPPVGDDETRLWDQLVVNEGRQGLSDGEQIAVFQQLSLMGRSAETIARRSSNRLEVVQAALRVAGSPVAAELMVAKPEMTLDQLEVIAEFDGASDALKELRAVADEPGRFRQVAGNLRAERDRRAAIAAFVAALPEGLTVLPEAPSTGDTNVKSLESLGHKVNGPALDPVAHAQCPGHAVHVRAYAGWGDDHRRSWDAHAEYYCTTWKTAGHVNRWASSASGATSGPQSEDAKAERRALIANNKAADAAETVRRDFIRDLLRRKKMPADAGSHVARILLAGSAVTQHGQHSLARELLYGKDVSDLDVAADLERPDRAMAYLVALAATVAEPMPRDFWHPTRASYGAEVRRLHLAQLQAWGYVLSDVEQLAMTSPKKGRAR